MASFCLIPSVYQEDIFLALSIARCLSFVDKVWIARNTRLSRVYGHQNCLDAHV
jgi:hypothetical protein